MKDYQATVFKSGNSYALRVTPEYLKDAGLQVGDKASISLPAAKAKKQDNAELIRILEELQEAGKHGQGLASIKDPVAWQREIRKDRPLPGRD